MKRLSLRGGSSILCGHTQLKVSALLSHKRGASVLGASAQRAPEKRAKKKKSSKAPISNASLQRFIQNLETSLGITEPLDWCNVSRRDLIAHGGKRLLTLFTSFAKVITRVYPDRNWSSSSFLCDKETSQWRDLAYQRTFLESVGEELGIKQLSDWYGITRKDVLKKKRIRGLFTQYTSLQEALRAVYPHYDWKFPDKTPSGYWKDKDNLTQALHNAEQRLGLSNPEDWHGVKLNDLQFGFPKQFNRGSLAKLLAEKHGLEWEDIINKWKEQKTGGRPKKLRVKPKIIADWRSEEGRQNAFRSFAQQMGFDPEDSNSWRRVKRSQIQEQLGLAPISRLYGNSLSRALKTNLPELTLPVHTKRPAHYWANTENQKEFFIALAKDMNFDPTVPSNWANIRKAHVVARKGGAALLNQFQGSLGEALRSSFPETQNEDKKCWWQNIKNCRNFFDTFARERNLDPLNPQHWYSIKLEDMHRKEGGRTIQQYHNGFRHALQQAYPEIAFDRW